MRKIQLLLVAVLAVMQLSAANVDLSTAQAKAEAFLRAHTPSGKMMASSPIKFVSQRTITNSSNVNVPVYYIFNTQDRFIIVSGEDRGEEILGCGDAPLDFNNIPSNMQNWLNFYQKQIEYLQARPGMVVEVQTRLNGPKRAQNVAPLLTARWDQTAPFYNQCIINNKQCVTGCPATSLAQVFYYWKYPTAETGEIPAYRFRDGYSWVNVPSLPSITFDWANMKDYYGWTGTSGTAAQKAAVAALMRYIGQVEHMNYGTDGSGISSDSTVLIANACKFFGYDTNVRAIKKSTYYGYAYYTDAQWANLIQTELEAGHPIVYCAISDEGQGGGHAFNVDGYTVSSNKYHINWGWSGTGNGDFALNAFTDYEGMTFDIYQQMVIGIQPPGGQVTFPVLNVDLESIDFGTVNTGETVTHTFNVSGMNLLDDVTFSVSGQNNFINAITITPETLTAEQVAAGATVTVTYSPLVAGTFSGSIKVASSGAEPQTIALTAEAVAVPILTATPSELSFTAAVGEAATGNFTLKGYNLTKVAYLKVVDATSGSGFSVSKSNVTAANATNGVDITVTFAPTKAGNHTARVMLRSAGADTIYVNLDGIASGGVTTYDPVMLPANADYVTSTSFRADWTDQTPAEIVSSYTLQFTGDGATSTIQGITNKYYTLENLTAGAMYSYKVMAFYTDGSQSNWSNVQEVTLLQGQTYPMGDINKDGFVTISDVTDLIDFLLSGNGDVTLDVADVDSSGDISISDVTTLIDMLLSGTD